VTVTHARDGSDDRRRTCVLRVDPHRPECDVIAKAARCLARGGLVAFPTETVYGLGADATDRRAVAAVFEAKGRPADNPLIVHVSSPAEVKALVRETPPSARALMQTFWPGPLSLILRRSEAVAPEVSCGLDTVAVRMPDHLVALELIRSAGVPVAAPSANVSGRPSPTRAEDVLADLGGRIDCVLDAGPCRVGVESTVLDLTGPEPVVLRPGGVTVEDLARVLGPVRVHDTAAGLPGAGDSTGAPKSPGLRHRHYSPRARLFLVRPGQDGRTACSVAAVIARTAAREAGAGHRVGVACTAETAAALEGRLPAGALVSPWGKRARAEEVAANLFTSLRDLDQAGVDVILAEGMNPAGLGLAVNDRLGRAAEAVIDGCETRTADDEAVEASVEAGAGRRGILLVCTGNTCRSPMAEALLRDTLRRRRTGECFEVGSAGVAALEGAPASAEARTHLAGRGDPVHDPGPQGHSGRRPPLGGRQDLHPQGLRRYRRER